jgi:MFS family permease
MGTTVRTGQPPGGDAPLGMGDAQIRAVLSGLMLGLLLAALDQTIVSTALPTIVGELGGLNHLSWVVTAYLVTSTASTPLWGKISDLSAESPCTSSRSWSSLSRRHWPDCRRTCGS